MRQIDADTLLEKVAKIHPWEPYPSEYAQGIRHCMELVSLLIKDAPTIEPSAQPEIIRCKDCKYAEVADPEDSQDGYTCQFHRGSIWFSGSYCSWAERREG